MGGIAHRYDEALRSCNLRFDGLREMGKRIGFD
jgi:hypothetical protein